jgi:hypothetical protein
MAAVGVTSGYWERVRASGFRLPEDRPLDDLTTELVRMLGDPDPDVRDGLAYPVLATWIGEGVYDDLLTGFGDGIAEGLFIGLGQDGTDTVLRRSFSALLLADTVLREQVARVVHSDAVFRWGDRAASWLVRERDLRGYIEGRGWAHAIAHGADLVAALARSQHFGKLELTVLLDVVADRLLTPTEYRLSHGEDDRLAFSVMTVLHRNLITIELLEPWVERLAAALVRPERAEGAERAEGTEGADGTEGAEGAEAESTTPEWPSAVAFNTASFLRELHLQLALGVRGGESTQDADLFRRPPRVRADLLLVLLRVLRGSRAWRYSVPD